MRPLKQNHWMVILLFMSCFAPTLTYAQSDEELQEITDAETDLLIGTATKRSAAATTLGKFKFQETKKMLLGALEEELDLQKSKPNSYIITAVIESLDSMVDKKDKRILSQCLKNADKIKEGWMDFVLPKLEALKDKAERTLPLDLPKMRKASNTKPSADSNSSAVDTSTSTEKNNSKTTLADQIRKGAGKGYKRDELAAFFNATEEILSDEIATTPPEKRNEVIGRDEIVSKVFDTLVRMKGKVPVLTGEAGVGKTAIAHGVADRIFNNKIGDWVVYQEELPHDRTYVVSTTPSRISRLALSNTDTAQAAALELYFDSILKIEKALNIKIIVFVDELHTLSKAQQNSLKTYTERLDGIRMIGASTYQEFLLMISKDDALKRRVREISTPELTTEQTFEVLKQGWLQKIENKYRAKISDENLRALIDLSAELHPDLAKPDAPLKFIQDVVIVASREAGATDENPVEVTEEIGRIFIQNQTGIPVDPNKPRELVEYIDNAKQNMKEEIVGQDHIVDLVCNTAQEVFTAPIRKAWRSITVLGPTGTGKTELGVLAALKLFKHKSNFLRIDATAYQTGNYALNALIGASPGVLSSDETKGILPEYLSGVGKLGGIILIDEFEKAHPDFAKRIMEMLERGVLTGGDGKTYRLGRHLIIFTSNRGSEIMFDRKLGSQLSKEELQRRVETMTDSEARELFIRSQSGFSSSLDQQSLPPEVVGRIDRWGSTRPLTLEDTLEIAKKNSVKLNLENKDQYKFELILDSAVIEKVNQISFTPLDGARPVIKKLKQITYLLRSEVWRALDQVDGATIDVQMGENEDKNIMSLNLVKDDQVIRTVDIPIPTKFMAVEDPRFREILSALESKLKEKIFGQDEAVQSLVKNVRGRAMRPFDRAPVSEWLLGPTGTGKTEMARVLAEVLYGSSERAQILSFGRVQHKYDLSDIFSPPKGVQGSGEPGPFERILQTFPDGTVIVFDEIGNVGMSQDRDAIFKSLYEIFEEGTWTNPHGKVYNLSNFVFLLTGNNGEELFEQLPTEDLREITWNQHRSRESIEKILRESGVPEAFINRIGGLTMMRSLSEKNRPLIARKFLDSVKKDFEKTYGIEIEFGKDFEKQISESFFPLNSGARGARRFVTIEVSDFIGNVILENYVDIEETKRKGKPPKLEITAKNNFPNKFWSVPEIIKPEIQLSATLKAGRTKLNSTERTVEPTSPPTIVHEEDARSTEIHEAGHAIVNEYVGKPEGDLEFLTVIRRGPYAGYARYNSSAQRNNDLSLDKIIRKIAVYAGGMKAQKAFDLPRDAGWQKDREMIQKLAEAAVFEFGLIPGTETLKTSDSENSSPMSCLSGPTLAKARKLMQDIIKEGLELAEKVVTSEDVKQRISDLADELDEKGSLDASEIKALFKNKVKNPERFEPDENNSSFGCELTFE